MIKLKVEKILNEKFDYDSLLRYLKHVDEYENDTRCEKEVEELKKAIVNFGNKYNHIADALANSFAGKSNSNSKIVGYIQDDGMAVKYDRENLDFVVYNPRSSTMKTKSLHKKTYNQYLNTLQRRYAEELPENQDD